jgi:hypothetical protein
VDRKKKIKKNKKKIKKIKKKERRNHSKIFGEKKGSKMEDELDALLAEFSTAEDSGELNLSVYVFLLFKPSFSIPASLLNAHWCIVSIHFEIFIILLLRINNFYCFKNMKGFNASRSGCCDEARFAISPGR